MARKISGKKFAGSHTTYIDAAQGLVIAAERNPLVKKISLGLIRSVNTGRGARSIKFKDTVSGLEVTIRGSSYVQTIWIYLFDNSADGKKKAIDQLKRYF